MVIKKVVTAKGSLPQGDDVWALSDGQIRISQVRGVVGSVPGKGGSQGNPRRRERAHAGSAELWALPVAGMPRVRGELLSTAPKNQIMKGLIPG